MLSEATNYRITILENGPYLVTGGVPLIRRSTAKSVYGEPLEWDQVGAEEEILSAAARYTLCRCGQSARPPFCDGAHARLDFDGALAADRRPTAERRKIWRAAGLILSDDVILCASAGFCRTRLIEVWRMIEHADDPEIRARLLRMVANCPSGRLETTLAGGEPIEPAYRPSIAVIPDGPLWVRGGIPIQAPDGFVYETRNRVTLCRCGKSTHKPFCDGTHEGIGFQAP